MSWTQNYDPLHSWPLATHQEGRESAIFQAVLVQSLALVGLIVMLYAFVIPAAIPPRTWPSP